MSRMADQFEDDRMAKAIADKYEGRNPLDEIDFMNANQLALLVKVTLAYTAELREELQFARSILMRAGLALVDADE